MAFPSVGTKNCAFFYSFVVKAFSCFRVQSQAHLIQIIKSVRKFCHTQLVDQVGHYFKKAIQYLFRQTLCSRSGDIFRLSNVKTMVPSKLKAFHPVWSRCIVAKAIGLSRIFQKIFNNDTELLRFQRPS